MGQRVLLISTNRCTAPDPVFPLGLAYLSAALEAAGHEARWYDLQVDAEPLDAVLSDFRPDLVGVSVRNIDDVLIRRQETYFDCLPEICSLVRRVAGCPVVLGGSGFSVFPRELLAMSGADYGICGAGEDPLVCLLRALSGSGDLQSVPGLVLRDGNSIRCSPPAHDYPRGTQAGTSRPHGRGALSVPAPIHGTRPARIVDYYLASGGMLNLQTQRGCACHCCYCTYPVIEGRAHRRHHPEQVAEELAEIERSGGRYAFIVDSVFNSSVRHVSEICEAILRRNLTLKWGCFLRPQGLTPELVRLMARAGLAHAEFGSDSLSDKVLGAYQKGFSFEEVRESSELARREKIDFCHFLIAGGPGETDATLTESFERSRLLEGAVFMAVVGMRIYPGTSLFFRAVAEGRIAPDANLLSPIYYLGDGLTQEHVFHRLEQFARQAPNWIVGDPVPGYARLVERLRKRGVMGPLWSYLSIIQRFWPVGTGGLPGSDTETARPVLPDPK